MYFFDRHNNLNNINWAEPIFIAMLKAYYLDENKTLNINNSYIKNMLTREHKKFKTYSPIEKIENNRMGLEKISTHLTDIMLQNFTFLSDEDKKDLKHYLQYLFLELMNNVADHARSRIGGYAMAQYYKENKKIQFAVADRGVAFLENIKLKFPQINNEEDAIYKALEPGITSTLPRMYNQQKNAGYGLYAMLEILKMTGGSFVIISNDTLIRYKDKKYVSIKLNTPWKGVVVAFEFFESEINYDMDYFTRNYLWKLNDDEEDDDFF